MVPVLLEFGNPCTFAVWSYRDGGGGFMVQSAAVLRRNCHATCVDPNLKGRVGSPSPLSTEIVRPCALGSTLPG